MRRICIYCETWESGGIEAFTSNILQHIDLTDLEIDIVADVLKKSVFTEKLESLGIMFWELSGSQNALVHNYCCFSALMNERKYDVIHLNVFQAVPLVYLSLAKRKGIPVRIAHSHNTMLRKSRTRALKMKLHRMARSLFTSDATDLWACSSIAADFMFPPICLQKKNWRFIPNGIDLQRFKFSEDGRRSAREYLNVKNAFVIGNVGRLCYQKNQRFLLDVFAQVYERNHAAKLLLVGEGELLAELKEKAKRLGIAEHVIFYGTSDRIEELLWAMDVFAFPSCFEGLGIAAIEAQATGLRLVCSEHVPREAMVSEVVRLSIDKPAMWVETLIRMGDKKRIDIAKNTKLSEFDVNRVGRWIEEKYRQ